MTAQENLSDLDVGTYNVTVTDTNGCTQTASASIAAPTEVISATNVPMDVSCFEGNDGTIDLTIENGIEPYTFDWDNDGTGDNDDTEDLVTRRYIQRHYHRCKWLHPNIFRKHKRTNTRHLHIFRNGDRRHLL